MKRSMLISVTVSLALALLVIFLSDLVTMGGFAHGMLYVVVVLLAMLTGWRRLILASMLISVGLIVVGGLFSPPAPADFPVQFVIANRLVSILVVIAAGVMAMTRIAHRDTRHRAEQALKQRDELLSMASKIAGVGGWSAYLDPPSLAWTDEVYRIVGVARGEKPDLQTSLNYYIERDQPRIREAVRRCLKEGKSFDEQARIINRTGQTIWVRAIGQALRDEQGHIIGAHGAFMDIDQAKRTAQRLTTTLESITDAFLLLDEQWRLTFMNAHAEALLERRREQLYGKVIWDEFPEARGSIFEAQYRQAVESGESISFEAYYPPLSRWFSIHAYPSDEGLAIYFQDITSRQALHARLQLLNAAIDRVNDMIVITEADPVDDPGPRIVYVNQAFERLTGHRMIDVLGQSPRFLQGPETSRSELDRIRRALENQESIRAVLVNYDRAGQSFNIEIDISPVFDDQDRCTHFVAIQRDISERINLEERLRQSQRLEAIGQLTGGIAHDFNNLLTVILGNAELIGEVLADDHELAEGRGYRQAGRSYGRAVATRAWQPYRNRSKPQWRALASIGR